MIIHIEPQSEIPIYTQITHQIIEGIARGLLRPGSTLPSVRAFAADLGINMHTVNKSYHQLEKKGIIRIVPKSGAVILPQDELVQKGSTERPRLVEQFKPVIAEAMVLGLDRREIDELISSVITALKE